MIDPATGKLILKYESTDCCFTVNGESKLDLDLKYFSLHYFEPYEDAIHHDADVDPQQLKHLKQTLKELALQLEEKYIAAHPEIEEAHSTTLGGKWDGETKTLKWNVSFLVDAFDQLGIKAFE